ncbi:uncharacterized protein LOC124314078 isoform X2 [Daphnia pulicaria]|nr:uncharacterized protein LOC124314078 isoform X2 [Daphnia pulicaria]
MSSMTRSSFRDSGATLASSDSDRRTVIVERLNGSFGFTLQSYGIQYREESDVEIVTYVDFVDPIGHAHKAGLRSGDVIVSINGQDVERADHATLVSIIQSCPDRIRMVVVYENCVRKVELHMKYIRLTQMLEWKAREYQEVCAREKTLISRMDKSRGSGPYYTMQHPSQIVVRRNPVTSPPSSCTPGSYSSKSLPRPQNHAELIQSSPTASGSSSHTGPRCRQKGLSYLCIGRSSDCDCCFRPEAPHKMQSASSAAGASEAHHHRSKQQQSQSLQRPRSVHLSCYKETSAASPDERYLIRPSDRTTSANCKAYGGYGFGYEYSTAKNHHPKNPIPCVNPRLNHPQYYGRYQTQSVAPHKSADDLLLAAQFQSQCHLNNSPHLRQPSFQEPFHPVHRGPVQPTPQQPQVQALDSISFYTRPTQPSAGHSTVGRVPSESHHHRHHHPHSQPPHYRPFYQPQAQQQLNSPGNDDEGGFNEARRFRTLPAASNAKRADYR